MPRRSRLQRLLVALAGLGRAGDGVEVGALLAHRLVAQLRASTCALSWSERASRSGISSVRTSVIRLPSSSMTTWTAPYGFSTRGPTTLLDFGAGGGRRGGRVLPVFGFVVFFVAGALLAGAPGLGRRRRSAGRQRIAPARPGRRAGVGRRHRGRRGAGTALDHDQQRGAGGEPGYGEDGTAHEVSPRARRRRGGSVVRGTPDRRSDLCADSTKPGRAAQVDVPAREVGHQLAQAVRAHHLARAGVVAGADDVPDVDVARPGQPVELPLQHARRPACWPGRSASRRAAAPPASPGSA